MKKSFFILFLIPLVISCNRNKSGAGNSATLKIKKEALAIACDYVNGKMKDLKKTVDSDGIITYGVNQSYYVINPANISVGFIDDDNTEDAIVSIDYFHGQYHVVTEHLILTSPNGKLMLNRTLESDMKVLGIKDRVITVEIYTKSRNGPLANCSQCKEVVKYRFKEGNLIKTE